MGGSRRRRRKRTSFADVLDEGITRVYLYHLAGSFRYWSTCCTCTSYRDTAFIMRTLILRILAYPTYCARTQIGRFFFCKELGFHAVIFVIGLREDS